MADNFLIISDLQIPFEHPSALYFCKKLKKYFKVSDENVINIGDEVDQYFGSLWEQDPDAIHSSVLEIEESKEKLRQWIDAFPYMKVCISNHGMRWARKASAAKIPSVMVKHYQEVLGIPETWQYKLEHKFNTRHPFRVIHGMGYSGEKGHINAALDSGMSTAIGHLASFGGVMHLRRGISEGYNAANKIWAMNTGCLIDTESYAFHYGKDHRSKPTLGCGLVLNSGTTPLFIPIDL